MSMNLNEIKAQQTAQSTSGKGFTPKAKADRPATAPQESAPQANAQSIPGNAASAIAKTSTDEIKSAAQSQVTAITQQLMKAAADDEKLVTQASDFLAGLHVTRPSRIAQLTAQKIQEAQAPTDTSVESLFSAELAIDVDWETLTFTSTSQPQLKAGA
jgi:hypothetical protein